MLFKNINFPAMFLGDPNSVGQQCCPNNLYFWRSLHMFLMASLGREPPDRMHISVSQDEGPRSPVSDSSGVSIEISCSGALPRP